jgi:hypothetical protein
MESAAINRKNSGRMDANVKAIEQEKFREV